MTGIRNIRTFLTVGTLVLGLMLLPAVARAKVEGGDPPSVSAGQEFWVEQLADHLKNPWSMAWLPNGDLLIVEKFGGIRIMRKGVLDPQPLAGAPKSYQAAQGGLLDIALDPDFKKNQRVFISYTEGDPDVAVRNAVYRARFDGNALVDGETIFRLLPDDKEYPFPTAGRIQFLPDKTFLLGSSSGEDTALDQKIDNHLGKILRLTRDGKAPSDNPFVNKPGALPEIYAYGIRSPLGLTRDPRDGTIWETENGPRGGDELNIIKPGGNYGWPLVSFGTEYSGAPITDTPEMPGIESPITYWVPSISPSGLAINLGKKYKSWRGDFFSGALGGKQLRRIRIKDGKVVQQEKMLADLNERIRDVRLGPDGYLYLLTDNANGRLLRLMPGQPKEKEMARVAKGITPAESMEAFRTAITYGRKEAARPIADPANGKKLFQQQCMSCHTAKPGAAATIGPNLFGVIGRKAGMGKGQVSPAMHASGMLLTESKVDQFLVGPSALIPGTTMNAPPVLDEKERRDILGYLKTLK